MQTELLALLTVLRNREEVFTISRILATRLS